MTISQREAINQKFKEIDEKLHNNNLTNEERQLLLEERAEYEEQSEELEFDEQSDDTCIEYETIYFKYCFEDCNTMDEIIEVLDELKKQFEEWKKEGHKLTQPVNNGYCFIDKIVEN